MFKLEKKKKENKILSVMTAVHYLSELKLADWKKSEKKKSYTNHFNSISFIIENCGVFFHSLPLTPVDVSVRQFSECWSGSQPDLDNKTLR